jgi:hypothetical protein
MPGGRARALAHVPDEAACAAWDSLETWTGSYKKPAFLNLFDAFFTYDPERAQMVHAENRAASAG